MDQKPMPEIVRRRIRPIFGLAIALVIAGLLATWAPSALACQGGRLPASRLTVDQARLTVTCLINGNRARHHVKPVHANLPLGVAAQTHTDAMVAQNFFSHGGDGTPASARGQRRLHDRRQLLGHRRGPLLGGRKVEQPARNRPRLDDERRAQERSALEVLPPDRGRR